MILFCNSFVPFILVLTVLIEFLKNFNKHQFVNQRLTKSLEQYIASANIKEIEENLVKKGIVRTMLMCPRRSTRRRFVFTIPFTPKW